MTRSLRLLIGSLAATAMLALGAGLALAHGGHATASPSSQPAQTANGDDGAESSTGAGHEQEPADTGDSSAGDSSSSTGATGNHGAIVSKVARETPPGPQHGKIVSAVARANHGAAQRAANASAHPHGG